MPRYLDSWVVDRTLFEFATGGSCACCGFSHLFHPQGLKGLIEDISDLETDAADAEFDAATKSPWPPQMRDQVWADRVRLRHKLKKEMSLYKDFMAEIGGKDGLKQFLQEDVGPSSLRRIIQMPRTEVMERIRQQYDIHSALGIVICAVVEQVCHFEITQYPPDGRSEAELAFETMLAYDRRGGFVLPIATRNTETRKYDTMNNEALDVLVTTIDSLGGPKLLRRAPKKKKETNDSGGDGDDDDDVEGGADDGDGDEASFPGQTGPSFRSDRRIVRLLIARYWADQIIHKYRSIQKKEEEENTVEGVPKDGQDDAMDGKDGASGLEAVADGVESLAVKE